MEDFSLFEHALRLAGPAAPDLKNIDNITRREFDAGETFLFRAPLACVEYVSLLIENSLLLRTHRGGRVYAGFERLSSLEPVVCRYMRIADVSGRVYVFGEPDWEPPRHPRVSVVPLRRGACLAREWFVVADSPAMSAALVAADEDGPDARAHERRHFRAFKTCDPALVGQLADAAERLADAAPLAALKAS